MKLACFQAVLGELSQSAPQGDAPSFGARGITSLQKLVDKLIDRHAKSSAHTCLSTPCEAYQAESALQREQWARLRKGLARYAWASAEQAIGAGVEHALPWFQRGEQLYFEQTTLHLLEVDVVNRSQLGQAYLSRPGEDAESESFWRRMVLPGGGARYFIVHAVAVMILTQIMIVAESTVGVDGGNDEKDLVYVLTNPLLEPLLREPSSMWVERLQTRVLALTYLPAASRLDYVRDTARQTFALDETHRHALREQDRRANELALSARETKSLRRRLTTFETSLCQLSASNRSLQTRLSERAAARLAADATAERDRLLSTQLLELRDAKGEVSKLEELLLTTSDELARTREFLDVVLQPAPRDEPAARPFADQATPHDWNVLFVGGHERMHHKLRKLMPNAVFLHPDRSQFDIDLLNQVDAVVYSISYCNHAQVYRVASEVRKRGLRAGYSNHQNVDLVMDEVRDVLFPVGSAKHDNAARVAA